MFFVINNKIYPFTPKILVIFANMAEAATFIATYFPSTFKQPYCFCLISNEDLNNMILSNIILRTSEKMKEAIKNKYDANAQKSQQNNKSEKPKNNGHLLPLILVGGLVFLVGVVSLVIWRRKRKIKQINTKQK